MLVSSPQRAAGSSLGCEMRRNITVGRKQHVAGTAAHVVVAKKEREEKRGHG